MASMEELRTVLAQLAASNRDDAAATNDATRALAATVSAVVGAVSGAAPLVLTPQSALQTAHKSF